MLGNPTGPLGNKRGLKGSVSLCMLEAYSTSVTAMAHFDWLAAVWPTYAHKRPSSIVESD